MNMGVIPENGTVYSDLTAEQNILWTAKFYGMDSISRKERADELLRHLGLTERRNDIVRTFSKGMRQRVSIACAIIHSPPVLFLDEPTRRAGCIQPAARDRHRPHHEWQRQYGIDYYPQYRRSK